MYRKELKKIAIKKEKEYLFEYTKEHLGRPDGIGSVYHNICMVHDVLMPYINGKQLLKKFFMNYPNAKALFISGYPKNIIAQQDLAESGVFFLQKPFNRVTLLSNVREILG